MAEIPPAATDSDKGEGLGLATDDRIAAIIPLFNAKSASNRFDLDLEVKVNSLRGRVIRSVIEVTQREPLFTAIERFRFLELATVESQISRGFSPDR